MTDFWSRLDAIRARHDVLRHPFYERWTRGELTSDELAFYAGQYRHAVVAVACASEHAAADAGSHVDESVAAELVEHAREEREHVAMWDGFCLAVGGTPGAAATPETAICARSWSADARRPWLQTLMALHAIEGAQPAIAAAKRAGLVAHYGVQEGPATEYFAVHERLDVEHAAAARALIETRVREGDEDALLAEAEVALRANWLLLDGVERVASRT